MSTESIARPSLPAAVSDSCASCGAPLADDQRYCLQCGERRAPMSSVLLGGPPSSGLKDGPPATVPGVLGAPGPGTQRADASNAVTVIAGVGVLLLAMGVGVLIGRAGASKPSAGPAQVITVAAPSGAAAPGAAANAGPAEAAFTDDWPSGTSGYAVQLQTLPASSTAVSAVASAKAAASAKGAGSVGALKSEHFSSLATGSFVIYAGVYHAKAEAEKALAGLKKSFPGAAVIAVSNRSFSSSASAAGGSGGSSAGAGGSSAGAGGGSGASHSSPATRGKSFEEKSKNLPNVIETH